MEKEKLAKYLIILIVIVAIFLIWQSTAHPAIKNLFAFLNVTGETDAEVHAQANNAYFFNLLENEYKKCKFVNDKNCYCRFSNPFMPDNFVLEIANNPTERKTSLTLFGNAKADSGLWQTGELNAQTGKSLIKGASIEMQNDILYVAKSLENPIASSKAFLQGNTLHAEVSLPGYNNFPLYALYKQDEQRSILIPQELTSNMRQCEIVESPVMEFFTKFLADVEQFCIGEQKENQFEFVSEEIKIKLTDYYGVGLIYKIAPLQKKGEWKFTNNYGITKSQVRGREVYSVVNDLEGDARTKRLQIDLQLSKRNAEQGYSLLNGKEVFPDYLGVERGDDGKLVYQNPPEALSKEQIIAKEKELQSLPESNIPLGKCATQSLKEFKKEFPNYVVAADQQKIVLLERKENTLKEVSRSEEYSKPFCIVTEFKDGKPTKTMRIQERRELTAAESMNVYKDEKQICFHLLNEETLLDFASQPTFK